MRNSLNNIAGVDACSNFDFIFLIGRCGFVTQNLKFEFEYSEIRTPKSAIRK